MLKPIFGVATEGGINKLSPLDEALPNGGPNNYKNHQLLKLDGLKRPGISLNATLLDEENNLYWGMGKGFTVLPGNYDSDSESVPVVQLNGIKLNQEFMDFQNPREGIESVFARTYDNVMPFSNLPVDPEFPFSLNHLTFDFSGIEWTAPHKIVYQYKLDGYDEDWSQIDKTGLADYRNLPADEYVFQVRSKGESGKWSKPYSYAFIIKPSIWDTLAARITYVVVFVLMIYGYGKIRTRRLEQQRKLLQQMVNEKTEELVFKNEEISKNANALKSLNQKLNSANENLEQIVKDRTAELQKINDQLLQYSFDMAHKVRRPLANILGAAQTKC